MNLIHLTSSRFFGGPERQMLGLALAMRGECRSLIASFSEGGRCGEFLQRAHSAGIEAVQLHRDTPRLMAATREVDQLIRSTQAQAVLCHGYKAGLVGLFAARRAGITTVEIKSGYGLDARHEARCLHVGRGFTDDTTFLGAHVVPPEFDTSHVYHLFVVRAGGAGDPDARARFRQHLESRGIQTLVHYPVAIPSQPAFADLAPSACPEGEALCRQVVSLPLNPGLDEAAVREVAAAVRDFR